MAVKKKPGRKPRAAKGGSGGVGVHPKGGMDSGGGGTKGGGEDHGSGKKTKAALSREYAEVHPKATVQEIADALGVTYNTVYQALNKKGGKKAGKKSGRKPGKAVAKHTANGHASVIETAAAFVASCGGLKAAQQVLEQLSIIGSH